MALQSEQINGRISNSTPNNPTMYPQWAQRMIHRMIQLSKRPDEYIIKFTVGDDGYKEMKILRSDREAERLGK